MKFRQNKTRFIFQNNSIIKLMSNHKIFEIKLYGIRVRCIMFVFFLLHKLLNVITQQAQDVEITSIQRWFNVKTLNRR